MKKKNALSNAHWDLEAGTQHFIVKWRDELHATFEILGCDRALALLVDHEIEAEYRRFRNDLYLAATGS